MLRNASGANASALLVAKASADLNNEMTNSMRSEMVLVVMVMFVDGNVSSKKGK